MKSHAIDAKKSKGSGDSKNQQTKKNKSGKIKDGVANSHQNKTTHQDQKLPRRNRPDNLILNIDKLWYGELLHLVDS